MNVKNKIFNFKLMFALVFSFCSGLFCADEFYLKNSSPEIKINFSFDSHRKHKKIDCAIKEKIECFELVSPGGINIPVKFFNRGRKKVIIAGQGFPGDKECLNYIANLFHDYDVVLFDYRWHNMFNFLLKPSTVFSPVESFLYKEKEEVVLVINHFRSLKKYDQVVGLGFCYSDFIFSMVQSESEEKADFIGFDKLILDSCWFSLRDFAQQISFDPYLPFRPQNGGAPNILKAILKMRATRFFVENSLNLVVPCLSIKSYLEKIKKTPILFIHGKSDKLVPLEDVFFKKIWESVKNDNKLAFITPFEHSYNDKNPIVYRTICDEFICGGVDGVKNSTEGLICLATTSKIKI